MFFDDDVKMSWDHWDKNDDHKKDNHKKDDHKHKGGDHKGFKDFKPDAGLGNGGEPWYKCEIGEDYDPGNSGAHNQAGHVFFSGVFAGRPLPPGLQDKLFACHVWDDGKTHNTSVGFDGGDIMGIA